MEYKTKNQMETKKSENTRGGYQFDKKHAIMMKI